MSQKVYVLKLKSGEELIARIDPENEEPTIVLDQPMGIPVSYTHLRAHET